MRRLMMALLALVISATPVMAKETQTPLKRVEISHVCMMNDMAYDRPQIPVEIGGKTYYGCCQMCAEKLNKEAALRTAKDPVSGKEVDKATAVIGAMPDGMVHYFESEENMKAFKGHAGGDDAHQGHEDHSGH